jgi:hypothetical protein
MVRGLPYRACGEQLGLIVGDQIKREVREISVCIGAIRRRSRRGSRRRRKRRRRPEREREREREINHYDNTKSDQPIHGYCFNRILTKK